MLIVLGLAAAIWIAGWALDLPRQARWLLLALLYVAVLAILAILPEAHPLRARLGGSVGNWLVIGAAGLLVLAYAMLLGRLRRAAGAREDRSTVQDGPPQRESAIPASAGREAIPRTIGPEPVAPETPDGPGTDTPRSPDPAETLQRYSRHILLREIGGPGQRRLGAAEVMVVGAGGIGAPLLLYLAAAGVGRITLVDDDRVALSNLQRQVAFTTADIGRPKVTAAAERLHALNPGVRIDAVEARLDPAMAARLIPGRDLVIDGSDSFATRALVNAACVAAGVPLLAAAVTQWEGQITLYDPARGAPCMACLFPEEPAPGLAPACAEAGVAGPLPGILGSMAALEAVKEIAGAGTSLRGRLLLYDGLHGETRMLTIRRRPDCPVCGAPLESGADRA